MPPGHPARRHFSVFTESANKCFRRFSLFSLENLRDSIIFAASYRQWLSFWPMSKEMMTQLIADYFKTQPVQKAWFFGSFARGEETPRSDVDILFVPDYSGKPSPFSRMEECWWTCRNCLVGKSIWSLMAHYARMPQKVQTVIKSWFMRERARDRGRLEDIVE